MARHFKDDDEAVIEKIMADGTFDALRHQLLVELRKDPELERYTDERIRTSKKLHDAAFAGADDKRLFEVLRGDEDTMDAITNLMLTKVWQSTRNARSPIKGALDDSVHDTICAVFEEREHGWHSAAPPPGRQQ